jgi:hypothetical protein
VLHNNELHSSKQQGNIALVLKAHVASVCFKCLICLRGMLQEFRMCRYFINQQVNLYVCRATLGRRW